MAWIAHVSSVKSLCRRHCRCNCSPWWGQLLVAASVAVSRRLPTVAMTTQGVASFVCVVRARWLNGRRPRRVHHFGCRPQRSAERGRVAGGGRRLPGVVAGAHANVRRRFEHPWPPLRLQSWKRHTWWARSATAEDSWVTVCCEGGGCRSGGGPEDTLPQRLEILHPRHPFYCRPWSFGPSARVGGDDGLLRYVQLRGSCGVVGVGAGDPALQMCELELLCSSSGGRRGSGSPTRSVGHDDRLSVALSLQGGGRAAGVATRVSTGGAVVG